MTRTGPIFLRTDSAHRRYPSQTGKSSEEIAELLLLPTVEIFAVELVCL